MGTQIPQAQEVADIILYNVDSNNKQSIRYIVTHNAAPRSKL
jgi:hypothetical protein